MRYIDFGTPTLLECGSLSACASLAHELGLAFIEINECFPAYQPSALNVDMLRRVMDENELYFTFHMDESFNPADFNDRVARVYADTMLETLTLAQAVGAPIVNIHLCKGVYVTLPDKKVGLYDMYKAQYLDKMRCFRELCDSAPGDTRICLENTEGFTPYQREALALLLESPRFFLTLDTGHAHAQGYPDADIYTQYNSRLAHMHLHDARETRNHLALFDGDIDIAHFLDLAKARNCRIVLETKTVSALRASVARLRERFPHIA